MAEWRRGRLWNLTAWTQFLIVALTGQGTLDGLPDPLCLDGEDECIVFTKCGEDQTSSPINVPQSSVWHIMDAQ
jgi:hypothetical protein